MTFAMLPCSVQGFFIGSRPGGHEVAAAVAVLHTMLLVALTQGHMSADQHCKTLLRGVMHDLFRSNKIRKLE